MVIGAMGDGCRHGEAAPRFLEPSCVGVGNVAFIQGLESRDLEL